MLLLLIYRRGTFGNEVAMVLGGGVVPGLIKLCVFLFTNNC